MTADLENVFHFNVYERIEFLELRLLNRCPQELRLFKLNHTKRSEDRNWWGRETGRVRKYLFGA